MAPHLARLRALVGHELLLIPSVSVLPVDQTGRVLLVRHQGQGAAWATVGGAIDIGESPAEAAVREAREEIGTDVRLVELLDVLGGPNYEVHYANGDRTAYVTSVYRAEVVGEEPAPDGDEVGEIGWFSRDQLPQIGLGVFARALLIAVGYLTRSAGADAQADVGDTVGVGAGGHPGHAERLQGLRLLGVRVVEAG
jgi:ADP-ribose pyrophosphatase YjhB (NUDIX family)